MKSLLRIAYRTMLRMHPARFRAEFGDEMLWIFDEASREGDIAHLFFDGIRSVIIQNAKPRIQQTQTQIQTAGPYYCEIDSSIPAFRFTQAGLIVLSCLFCLFSVSLFVSMVVPKLTVPDRGLLFTRIRILSPVPTPGPQRSSH